MRAVAVFLGFLALAGCTDTSVPTASPSGGPQVAETVVVTLNSVLYSVSFAPAGEGSVGPRVTVARTGGAFLAGDKETALAVAQKYCAGTGRAPVSGAPMQAAREDGKWEFTNLCR